VDRRAFLQGGAALGTMLQGTAQAAQKSADHTADIIVVGAGASGLPAAIMARDQGASVIVIDANHDIGGHAMISGGRVPLGGGTRLQKQFGVADSADQVFLDHTDHRNKEFRFGDRELVRMWADENAATFDFLLDNGVVFDEVPPTLVNGGTVPRLFIAKPYSDNLKETINGSPGSGLMRNLEKSARSKGANILLSHKLVRLIREKDRVAGLVASDLSNGGREVTLRARKGVILCSGGHTSNVEFRRMFDPRLTEEYQTAGEPWTRQMAEGELAAMDLGAALWGTSNTANEKGYTITKTIHIGCRYGYRNLQWNPNSPMFARAGASGLSVRDFQNVILVNQVGQRFWNEMDESYDFFNACLGTNGSLGESSGGGPIWAIFDAAAVERQKWDPRPPNVDPNGWFFSAPTLGELADRIANPYQRKPVPRGNLEQSVARYNTLVAGGADTDFQKPAPKYRIEKAPFYAAWATPILHDSLTGLRINRRCQVIDLHGRIIPGLYAAGETAGGFALHGLPRVIVFGRVAGREAARA